jgi:hypothetical protein
MSADPSLSAVEEPPFLRWPRWRDRMEEGWRCYYSIRKLTKVREAG